MRLYLRAVGYFRQDWKLIVCQLGLILTSTVVGLLTAWPMAILIDSVLIHSDSAAAADAAPDLPHRLFLSLLPLSLPGRIVGLAGIVLGLKLAGDVLSVAQTVCLNHINYNGLMRVRCDLYRKLQALNLTYHKSQPQGDAIYRLSSDTFGCQTILGVMISTAVAAITLVAMACVLWTRSASLTLLALSVMPVLAAANVIFGRRLKARSLECKEHDTRFTTTVQRALSCIGLVQAFGREQEEFGRFHRSVEGTIRAWWRLNWQQMAYNLIVGTTFGVGGAVVFGYGGWLVHQGKLTVGDLMIFTSYLGLLWGPLCTLTGSAANMQGGVAGAQRVFEVLDRDPGIADAPDARPLPTQPRTLTLDGVGFEYVRGTPILRNVSAEIKPGQMVAFVGSSGVGKSTILNLLPRFYDPTGGAVRFDGIDARAVRVADLRKHVALVLQESVILPTTVAENIAYGRPLATREEVRRAAQLAGAAEFIEQLPDGYDTEIAEGGANLSGGQRQRLSIARALLTEAPFVVLDEPTSALDPHHEHLITQALRTLKGTRTIVLVSHRLSTVVHCDQIFVMDAGRIIEQGTHEALLERRGLYYDMARHQLGLEPDRDEPRPTPTPRTQPAVPLRKAA